MFSKKALILTLLIASIGVRGGAQTACDSAAFPADAQMGGLLVGESPLIISPLSDLAQVRNSDGTQAVAVVAVQPPFQAATGAYAKRLFFYRPVEPLLPGSYVAGDDQFEVTSDAPLSTTPVSNDSLRVSTGESSGCSEDRCSFESTSFRFDVEDASNRAVNLLISFQQRGREIGARLYQVQGETLVTIPREYQGMERDDSSLCLTVAVVQSSGQLTEARAVGCALP